MGSSLNNGSKYALPFCLQFLAVCPSIVCYQTIQQAPFHMSDAKLNSTKLLWCPPCLPKYLTLFNFFCLHQLHPRHCPYLILQLLEHKQVHVRPIYKCCYVQSVPLNVHSGQKWAETVRLHLNALHFRSSELMRGGCCGVMVLVHSIRANHSCMHCTVASISG